MKKIKQIVCGIFTGHRIFWKHKSLRTGERCVYCRKQYTPDELKERLKLL